MTGATPETSETAMRAAKAALRRAVLARRDAVPAATRRDWSAAIVAALDALPALHRAGLVLAYCSFGSELETGDFLRAVLARGQGLVLPRVDRPGRRLELRRVDDLDGQLLAGTWGIREPDPRSCPPVPAEAVEFALVPGVAFDAGGGRLGYGGGYYDRLLPALAGRAPLVAGAFEVQVVEAVPAGAGDWRVELVVTERTTYSPGCGAGQGSEAC